MQGSERGWARVMRVLRRVVGSLVALALVMEPSVVWANGHRPQVGTTSGESGDYSVDRASAWCANQPSGDGSSVVSRSPGGRAMGVAQGSVQVAVLSDRHGDVTATVAAGGLVDSVAYSPWGEVSERQGSTGLVVGFQGSYTDPSTGLVDMGARWYQPSTSTFTARDTYNGQLSTPISLNRYTYAQGDPLSYFDPDGRMAISVRQDGMASIGRVRSAAKAVRTARATFQGALDALEMGRGSGATVANAQLGVQLAERLHVMARTGNDAQPWNDKELRNIAARVVNVNFEVFDTAKHFHDGGGTPDGVISNGDYQAVKANKEHRTTALERWAAMVVLGGDADAKGNPKGVDLAITQEFFLRRLAVTMRYSPDSLASAIQYGGGASVESCFGWDPGAIENGDIRWGDTEWMSTINSMGVDDFTHWAGLTVAAYSIAGPNHPIFGVIDYNSSVRQAVDGRTQIIGLSFAETANAYSGPTALANRGYSGSSSQARTFHKDFSEPESPSSEYRDITKKGSRVRNVRTNVPREEFEANLDDSGYQPAKVADTNNVVKWEKDGVSYVVRNNAGSTGAPTAEYYPVGSRSFTVKIRLPE